jgi:hypothetical protein
MSEQATPYVNPSKNATLQRIEGMACNNKHCDKREMIRVNYSDFCPECGHPLRVAVVELVPYAAKLRFVG